MTDNKEDKGINKKYREKLVRHSMEGTGFIKRDEQ